MSQYFAQWRNSYHVTWRNLTWAEYKKFRPRYEASPFKEPADVALDIYKTVYTQGPDPAFVPAGIPCFICKQQMVNNPFSGIYSDLAPFVEMARRAVATDYLHSAKALVAYAFNYKIEEMDEWEPNKFFIRLAQAEVATGRTFDPVDPNAQKEIGKPGTITFKKSQKPLTQSQQNAIARTREARVKE